MSELKPFRVSSGLKNLIGRDLITDDFVAIFELVKNSFDAHASLVRISFETDAIVITDNGKGMSRSDLIDKWLFVAFSAKREGTEDDDYRSTIERRSKPYAGAKGVGRFSCDRLGSTLSLYTRSTTTSIEALRVDWTLFEDDAHLEFGEVMTDLVSGGESLPDHLSFSSTSGTILEIKGLRSDWGREKLIELRRELSKLIDPFASDDNPFSIAIIAPNEVVADEKSREFNETRSENQSLRPEVNGLIRNQILSVLGQRTTVVRFEISKDGMSILTSLEDRGETVYRISEANPYPELKDTRARADIYFLNRSAKQVFALRMGLPSVQFGSVFLFRNGFRVFPVGAEADDFFGLNRRKQQGQRRFLGNRDLIGRVDIKGADGFDEATSRNQGLIRNPSVDALINFVRDKGVKRLERYVVDITWKDAFDKDSSDLSRMTLDSNSALISTLVSRLASTDGVELLYYNPDLIKIVDEKSAEFESSLRALELLGEKTGDRELLAHIVQARARLKALEDAEDAAREAERRAEYRATQAERVAGEAVSQLASERERNSFLVAAGSLDQDTILNLHHQIIIHAADVHTDIQVMMTKLRSGEVIERSDWVDMLERVAYRNSQILTAARFATKGGYKQRAAEIKDDIGVYVRDYVENVSSLWSAQGLTVSAEWDGAPAITKFKPIEIGIVIDNLVTNAEKAGASRISFAVSRTKGPDPALKINVADNGRGWNRSIKPLDSVFEKGVTSTHTGSGLGLFHARQVVQGMRGTLEASLEQFSPELDGAHLILRLPL